MTESNQLNELLENLASGGLKEKEQRIIQMAEAYTKVFSEAKGNALALMIYYMATMEVEVRDLKEQLKQLKDSK